MWYKTSVRWLSTERSFQTKIKDSIPMKKYIHLTLLLSIPQVFLQAERFTEYFKDGVVKSHIHYLDGSRTHTQEGIKEGLEEIYYEEGKLAYKVNNTQGKRHGEMHWYDQKGRHLEVIHYDHGLRHGHNQIFFDNGNLRIEVKYIHDKKEGLEKYYFSNGMLASKVNYIHDRKEGIQEEYDKEGVLENTVTYKHGYKEGNKYWYNKKGKIIQTRLYKMDRPIHLMKKIQMKKEMPTIEGISGLDFNPNK